MRLDRQEDVEIARRPATQPRLALAGEPDAGAVLDAGRNVDGQRALLAARGPGRAQVGHGLLMIWPRPLAGRAGALDGEEALAARAPGRAPRQVGQVVGLAPALAPVPGQISQVTVVGTLIFACLPAKASSSVISHVVAKVGAALAAALRRRARRP